MYPEGYERAYSTPQRRGFDAPEFEPRYKKTELECAGSERERLFRGDRERRLGSVTGMPADAKVTGCPHW